MADPTDGDGGIGDVAVLVGRLGLQFDDLGLVEQAMSHRSWCAEHPGNASYERLEFLGDAVLGWVTADAAFRRFPDMSEGQLTGIRKGVVNTMALAEMAAELGIGPYIKLGKGEAAAGGSSKPSILADAMEALIGAVYLDRGSTMAYEFVESLIADRVEATAERLDELDFKTTLAGAPRRRRGWPHRCTTSPSRGPITRSASSPPCPPVDGCSGPARDPPSGPPSRGRRPRRRGRWPPS